MKARIPAILLGLMMISGVAAQADTAIAVQSGVLNPTGTNVVNSGNLTFGGELEWQNSQSASALSVSADYVPIRRSDNQLNSMVPVLANYKWYTSADPSHTRAFLGVGAGATVGDFGGFAWQGEAGLDFSQNWQAEVRYIGTPNGAHEGPTNSTVNNLFGAEVGYRF